MEIHKTENKTVERILRAVPKRYGEDYNKLRARPGSEIPMSALGVVVDEVEAVYLLPKLLIELADDLEDVQHKVKIYTVEGLTLTVVVELKSESGPLLIDKAPALEACSWRYVK